MNFEGIKFERVVAKSPQEAGKIKIEDVFEYNIEDLRKGVENNPDIDAFDKEHYFLPDLPKKQEIEEFSKNNPKRFEEVLEKLKQFYPKGCTEEKKEKLKTGDEKFIKDYLTYRNFSKIEKLEKLNPPKEIKKFVDKFVSLNGALDQESFEILKEMIDLKPDGKEMGLLEKMAEISIEPKIDFTWTDFLKAARNNKLGAEEKKWIETLSDKKKIEKVKTDIKEIEKKLADSSVNLVSQWHSSLKIGDDSKKEKIFSETGIIKNIIQNYNLQWLMDGEWLLNFNNLPNGIKEDILSRGFKQKFKEFNLDAKFFELDDIYKIFRENKNEISIKGEKIKKLFAEFKVEKINKSKFQDILRLPETRLDKALERDFSSLPKEVKEILENSLYYKQTSSKIFENIRKTKGAFLAKDISRHLLKYISSSLTLSYLAFEKPSSTVFNKLHKLEKNHPTLRNKILDQRYRLKLEDVVPGRKATEGLIGKGNAEYLSAAYKLGVPLDIYGIIGYDLDELKNYVRATAGNIIEDYDKEKHQSYLPHLVGYGVEYKKAVNDILKNENLWDYKFSQEEDLYKILENIKNLKTEVKDMAKIGGEEISLGSVEILKKPEEHLAAMNIEPTCMSAVGDFNYGAIAIAAGPILIEAYKNNKGEILGRRLLIPVKDKSGKWRFEEKAPYGLGERHLNDFGRQMEKVLTEKNKEYYKGVKEIITKNSVEGRLPKTKQIPFLNPELWKFWREDWGLAELKEAE